MELQTHEVQISKLSAKLLQAAGTSDEFTGPLYSVTITGSVDGKPFHLVRIHFDVAQAVESTTTRLQVEGPAGLVGMRTEVLQMQKEARRNLK